MRSRNALVVAVAGWLLAGGVAGVGCGELRQNLGDGGGSGDGAATDRAASDRGAVDLPPPSDVGAGSGGTAGSGGGAGTGGGSGGGDAGPADVPPGGGDAAAADAGGSGGVGGGGSDARADGAADARDAPAGDGGDAREAGGGAPNGTMCLTGIECASGNCVDGYCCNDACPGQCEACDVERLLGSCAPVVSGAPHGARTPCVGGSTCGGQCMGTRNTCTYPGPSTSCRPQSCTSGMRTQAGGCDGLGACAPVVTMTCLQGCAGNDCLGACINDDDCRAAMQGRDFCDTGTGMCTQRKPDGRTCAAGTECTSGYCADGYCCNSECTEQCRSCKEMGTLGRCILVSGAPRTGGTPARSSCGGTGECAGRCDGASPTCWMPTSSTSCGSPSCSGGNLTPVGGCNGAGSCAQAAGPCPTGYCSSATTCGNCPDDGSCGAGRWCDAGVCRARRGNGEACTADAQCLDGNCETNAAGTGSVCCAAACSGATPRCNAAGAACICSPTSCPIGRVCNQADGACCMPDACYSGPSCRTIDCVPGCGLATLPRNCGCTMTGCCGNTCCVVNMCSGTTCDSSPQTCL